mmetsp:Transcript_19057/g.31044  ORF Transcript_19057/g.31044 Transcript_19057/m.31044 type:complete len:237 (-) Transcript_19057:1511-2221(-)
MSLGSALGLMSRSIVPSSLTRTTRQPTQFLFVVDLYSTSSPGSYLRLAEKMFPKSPPPAPRPAARTLEGSARFLISRSTVPSALSFFTTADTHPLLEGELYSTRWPMLYADTIRPTVPFVPPFVPPAAFAVRLAGGGAETTGETAGGVGVAFRDVPPPPAAGDGLLLTVPGERLARENEARNFELSACDAVGLLLRSGSSSFANSWNPAAPSASRISHPKLCAAFSRQSATSWSKF